MSFPSLVHQEVRVSIDAVNQEISGHVVLHFSAEDGRNWIPINYKGMIGKVEALDPQTNIWNGCIYSQQNTVASEQEKKGDPICLETFSAWRMQQCEVIIETSTCKPNNNNMIVIRISFSSVSPTGCTFEPGLTRIAPRPDFARVWLPCIDKLSAKCSWDVVVDIVADPNSAGSPRVIGIPVKSDVISASEIIIVVSHELIVRKPPEIIGQSSLLCYSQTAISDVPFRSLHTVHQQVEKIFQHITRSELPQFDINIVICKSISSPIHGAHVILLPETFCFYDPLAEPISFLQTASLISAQLLLYAGIGKAEKYSLWKDIWIPCGASGAIAWFILSRYIGANTSTGMLREESISVRRTLSTGRPVILHPQGATFDPESSSFFIGMDSACIAFRKATLCMLQLCASVVTLRRDSRQDACAWFSGIPHLIEVVMMVENTEGLIRRVSSISDMNLDRFVELYVTTGSNPEVVVSVEYDAADKKIIACAGLDPRKPCENPTVPEVDVLIATQEGHSYEPDSDPLSQIHSFVLTVSISENVGTKESPFTHSGTKPLKSLGISTSSPAAASQDPIHYIIADPYQRLLLCDVGVVQQGYKLFIQIQNELTVPGKLNGLQRIADELGNKDRVKNGKILKTISNNDQEHYSVRSAAVRSMSEEEGELTARAMLRTMASEFDPSCRLDLNQLLLISELLKFLPSESIPPSVDLSTLSKYQFSAVFRSIVIAAFPPSSTRLLSEIIKQDWRKGIEICSCLDWLAEAGGEVLTHVSVLSEMDVSPDVSAKCLELILDQHIDNTNLSETYLKAAPFLPQNIVLSTHNSVILSAMMQRFDERDIFQTLFYSYCVNWGGNDLFSVPCAEGNLQEQVLKVCDARCKELQKLKPNNIKPVNKVVASAKEPAQLVARPVEKNKKLAAIRLSSKEKKLTLQPSFWNYNSVKRLKVPVHPSVSSLELKVPSNQLQVVQQQLLSLNRNKIRTEQRGLLLEIVGFNDSNQNHQIGTVTSKTVVILITHKEVGEMLQRSIRDILDKTEWMTPSLTTLESLGFSLWSPQCVGGEELENTVPGTGKCKSNQLSWFYDKRQQEHQFIASFASGDTNIPSTAVGDVIHGSLSFLPQSTNIGIRRCSQLWLVSQSQDSSHIDVFTIDLYSCSVALELLKVVAPHRGLPFSFENGILSTKKPVKSTQLSKTISDQQQRSRRTPTVNQQQSEQTSCTLPVFTVSTPQTGTIQLEFHPSDTDVKDHIGRLHAGGIPNLIGRSILICRRAVLLQLVCLFVFYRPKNNNEKK